MNNMKVTVYQGKRKILVPVDPSNPASMSKYFMILMDPKVTKIVFETVAPK